MGSESLFCCSMTLTLLILRLVELTQPNIAETDFIAVILQFDWRAAMYWLLRMTYPFGGAGNFTVILYDHAVMKHCNKTWA